MPSDSGIRVIEESESEPEGSVYAASSRSEPFIVVFVSNPIVDVLVNDCIVTAVPHYTIYTNSSINYSV